MEFVIVMALVVAAIAVVAWPLGPGRSASSARDEDARRAELEASRDAKYREIRDTELDFQTGKLSDAEWRAQDRRLRKEAIELLERLDALGEPLPAESVGARRAGVDGPARG